jgi:hypothetical protein
MLKVKLDSVDFDFVNNISSFGVEEFEKSGLYKVFLGSRNIVEDIKYIGESNELEYRDEDELINESVQVEGNEDIREYFEEFCSSWVEDNKVVYEILNEEECYVYFYLIV